MNTRTVRQPAVAGMFYPDVAGALRTEVETLLESAGAVPCPPPKALIVPHAGYAYSGAVAASAYARLRPHRERYARLVLLGPAHRVAFQGLATSTAEAFRTPLGDVPLDRETIGRLTEAGVPPFDAAHLHEHSLEVHLPFLQVTLGGFSLVPVVVGDASPDNVAAVIRRLWGGDETLIVASSDLSHYLPYELAKHRDRSTCEAIERFEAGGIGHRDACGAIPVGGLLIEARRRGLSITTADLRNSGDTAGDKGRVVGYGAWVLSGA